MLRDQLAEFTEIGKQEYIKTQKIINAFENDKIKDPINDIETLFSQMSFTSLNIDEIANMAQEVKFNRILPFEEIKNKIDTMHVRNLFKLRLMDCFEYNPE